MESNLGIQDPSILRMVGVRGCLSRVLVLLVVVVV